MDFLSGFSLCHGGKSGVFVENKNFKITFSEIFCNGMKNVISHGFECCYEWREVMEQMLLATEDFVDIDTFENKSEEFLQQWLGTFRGWGLLSSMLPSSAQYFFIAQLTKTRRNWSRQEVFTHQAAFEEVIARYEHDGKELMNLIPDFGISIDELVENNENERKKLVTLHFDAKWKLEVKFTIEKKRVRDSLLEFAAEKVGHMLEHEAAVDELEIPEVLKKQVAEKVRDGFWIRSHKKVKNYFFSCREDK